MLVDKDDGVRIAAINKINDEKVKALLGTAFLLNFPNLLGALFPRESAYSDLLVEKIALLVADIAAVKTTKFKIPAAAGIPIAPKTCTNGLVVVTILFQG